MAAPSFLEGLEMKFIFLMLARRLKSRDIYAAILFLAGSVAQAQTVGPVVAEHGKKADGFLQVTNNQIYPIVVVVSAMSGTETKEGKTTVHELDATTHLKLARNTVKLAPKEIYNIPYSFSCDTRPCIVAFNTGFILNKVDNGVAVKAQITTFAVSCDKADGCRKEVRRQAGVQ
jgi:hypothetical protein